MESYTKLAIVAIVLVATLVTEPMATNGYKICGVTTDGLKTCQPAVAKNVDPLPSPTPDCCAALGDADMPCFCKYEDMLGNFNIDPKHAMELPAKCQLKKWSNFHC
ncbi:putative lipid-transfer protein DIR1 [Helianthus annuus]|nr:putative lipid-transfer protein DIR1 [Helianthus annuus]KAJ0744607.1 putative lipid-transfer protein DIR1 [Helianthus annuus]